MNNVLHFWSPLLKIKKRTAELISTYTIISSVCKEWCCGVAAVMLFASLIVMFCSFVAKWCDVFLLTPEGHITRRSRHHARSAHHVPLAEHIVPKTKAVRLDCFRFCVRAIKKIFLAECLRDLNPRTQSRQSRVYHQCAALYITKTKFCISSSRRNTR